MLRKPKCVGGLGILNLEVQNIYLLGKWIFKLLNEEGWQEMLRKKYFMDKSPVQMAKQLGDSQFWNGLMDIQDQLLSMGHFEVHDGRASLSGVPWRVSWH
jgi:hypothetical protein